MASRRTRIKGIANIPPRKKPSPNVDISLVGKIKFVQGDEATSGENGTEPEHEETGDLSYKDSQISGNNSKTHAVDREFETNDHKINLELESPSSSGELNHPTSSKTIEESINNSKYSNTTTENETISNHDEPAEINLLKQVSITEDIPGFSNIESIELKLEENLKSTISENESVLKPNENETTEVKPIVRRKFLKPKVNLNFKNINRNAVDESKIFREISTAEIPIGIKVESNKLQDLNEATDRRKVGDKVVVLSQIRILANNVAQVIPETTNNVTMQNADLILNEAQLNSNELLQKKSPTLIFSPHKRYISESQASDSEYPAPPPSPSKFNRGRIKAIPKLGFRKTSCSASESEDETRKYGRIRNNSVCSVASTSTYLEPATPTSESVPPKETPMLPKKLIKTEQSKKLAEAKRDFQRRFGAKTPDKHKLRMIDLIYYNPETNPMSQQKPNNPKSDTDTKDTTEAIDEEQVDDPIEGQKENETDNMPVPQIKIGPSGEIILDEQSLIVENADLAKQKEQISNSSIVDGDFDTGYGIYKRANRAVNWSQRETLRFYKALNLIGTDFSIMTELFPRRTRRELKMKFKKEEKTNRHLIDKAILEPCSYNYTDLKREMQIEEEEEAFLIKLRNEEGEKRKQKKMENLKEKSSKKEGKIKSKGALEDNSEEITETETKVKKSKAKRKMKLLSITSVLEDSEEDGDISDTLQSDTDEEEIIPFLKPTRSGRIPKGTIKFTDSPEEFYQPPKKRFYKKINSDELKASLEGQGDTTFSNSQVTMLNHAARNRRLSSTSSVESNSERLVPGSVVITTEEGPNNESEYKVFMVTPDKKMVPLQLDSSVIERLVKERQSAELPLNPENNMTIPSNEADFIIKDNGQIL